MTGWKTIGNFLSQWYQVKWWRKFCVETLKKVFSNEKKWLQKRSSATSSKRIFFIDVYIINKYFHTVFLVQFEINLHLWVLQKAEFALVQINSKLHAKSYDYPHQSYCTPLGPVTIYGLLTKLVYVSVHKHTKKRTWPISSHLDRTSLVNKGFIIWLSGKFFLRDTAGSPERAKKLHLAGSGSQSQRRIWFILPAHGASHIIKLVI